MVDIQSPTAEIRRGRKERRRKKKKLQDENIMSASATQDGHNDALCARSFVHVRVVASGQWVTVSLCQRFQFPQ